jgi:Protein of unknwon function (DUF3310)
MEAPMSDVKPEHYPRVHGGDCLSIIQQLNLSFCLGNAMKYIWRAGRKDPSKKIEDLEKAREYLDREISILKIEAWSYNKGHAIEDDTAFNPSKPVPLGPIARWIKNQQEGRK